MAHHPLVGSAPALAAGLSIALALRRTVGTGQEVWRTTL